MHLNIQSLRTKLDLISIFNFNSPFRIDRVGRRGRRVAIYVRDGITAIERPDLSVNGVKAIWVDIKINRKTLLVGGFYRPSNSNNNHWNLIEHNFDQAVDDILIAGDFNINQTIPSNKLSNLIKSYNAHQLINNPTHFTENSKSIINVIILKHAHNAISSFVSDPISPALTIHHCSIACVLKFAKLKTNNYRRHIRQG